MSLQSPPPTSPYHGLPMTSLQNIILTTGPLIFFWSTLRKYVDKSGRLPIFTYITVYNSQFYAICNGIMVYLLLQSYLHPVQVYQLPFTLPIIQTRTLRVETWMLGYVYHISKFYEYTDIFNLVAQGIPIGSHMAFHHITTPYLTYFRIISLPALSGAQLEKTLTEWHDILAVDDWRVFALANCIHHTIMYAYFGHLGDWLLRVKTVTGYVQLALGVGTDAYWMYRTQGGKTLIGSDGKASDEATNRGIAILILVRYAMLYWEERRQIVEKERKAVVGRREREGVEEAKKRE